MKYFIQQNMSSLSLFFLILVNSQLVIATPDISSQISQQINRTTSQAISKNISEQMVKPVKNKRIQVRIYTKEKVREAQQRLLDLGFNPGAVDGLMGKRTRNAIQNFQRSRKVKSDGLLTESLLQQLYQ